MMLSIMYSGKKNDGFQSNQDKLLSDFDTMNKAMCVRT